MVAALGVVLVTSCVPRPPTFFPPAPISWFPRSGTRRRREPAWRRSRYRCRPATSRPTAPARVSPGCSCRSTLRSAPTTPCSARSTCRSRARVRTPCGDGRRNRSWFGPGRRVLPAGVRGRHAPRRRAKRGQQLPGVGWDDLVRSDTAATGDRLLTGADRARPCRGTHRRRHCARLPRVGAVLGFPPPGALRRHGLDRRRRGPVPRDRVRAPGLPPEQQTELAGYLVRPTDPRSPFGPAPAAAAAPNAAAPGRDIHADEVRGTEAWFPMDTSGSADVGFRAWVCDVSERPPHPG